jgi:rare lipoprotein A
VIVQGQTQFRLALSRDARVAWIVWLALLLALSFAFTGCTSKKKTTQAKLPPPPSAPVTQPAVPRPTTPEPATPAQPELKPEWTQVGIASWYVPEPPGRRTASGEAYDRAAYTAAHRTLPLQSLVRVTNLKTNRQAIVRINDRGPFINPRIIDLSLASAKALDVWGPGLAQVKLEVLHAPAAIDIGGKWCVQIGAFSQHTRALDLKQNLMTQYRWARVLEFAGSTGYWVRVRVQDDDRRLAQEVAGNIKVNEGGVFLVRLD